MVNINSKQEVAYPVRLAFPESLGSMPDYLPPWSSRVARFGKKVSPVPDDRSDVGRRDRVTGYWAGVTYM